MRPLISSRQHAAQCEGNAHEVHLAQDLVHLLQRLCSAATTVVIVRINRWGTHCLPFSKHEAASRSYPSQSCAPARDGHLVIAAVTC